MKSPVNSFILLFLLFFVSASFGQEEEPATAIVDVEYQSYLAHIAAANSSLRLNEPNEARRWLESSPVRHRGWEYQYLFASLDKSLGLFDSLETQPLSLSFSSNGKLLAVACTDSTVWIYNTVTKKVIKQLKGHNGPVYSAKFFDDGRKILTCSRDSTVRVWTIEGEVLWEAFAGGHGLQDADINPKGDKVAYCSWQMIDRNVVGIVSLWDLTKDKKIWTTNFDTKPNVVVKFSPDGKRFAVGTWGWRVGIWETENPSEPIIFDFDDVSSYSAIDDIAFSPDGRLIAGATKKGSPRVWNIETRQKVLELHGHDQSVMAVAFSPDGNQIYTAGSDATIAIWDAATGIRLAKLFGHRQMISKISFQLGHDRFVTTSTDNTIRLWDSRTGLEFQDERGRSRYVYGYSLSGDGTLLASGGEDGTIAIWNALTGEFIKKFPVLNQFSNAIDFGPDGKMVVCSWDTVVNVVDVETGDILTQCYGLKSGSSSCSFSFDGSLVASASNDKSAYIWDAVNGAMLKKFPHNAIVYYTKFSPSGEYFVSASNDGHVNIWSMEDFSLKTRIIDNDNAIRCVDFAPDNSCVATVGKDGIGRVWDIHSGELLLVLNGHTRNIWSVVYNPIGDRIATGSSDNTVRIWDARTGACTLIISDLSNAVYNIAFSPDGTKLYANSSGTELAVFDIIPLSERIR